MYLACSRVSFFSVNAWVSGLACNPSEAVRFSSLNNAYQCLYEFLKLLQTKTDLQDFTLAEVSLFACSPVLTDMVLASNSITGNLFQIRRIGNPTIFHYKPLFSSQ